MMQEKNNYATILMDKVRNKEIEKMEKILTSVYDMIQNASDLGYYSIALNNQYGEYNEYIINSLKESGFRHKPMDYGYIYIYWKY